jgi:hypothetical protein
LASTAGDHRIRLCPGVLSAEFARELRLTRALGLALTSLDGVLNSVDRSRAATAQTRFVEGVTPLPVAGIYVRDPTD